MRGAPGGFPVGLAAFGPTQLEQVMAKKSEQVRQGSQQENETKDEQDSADDQAHGMAEPHTSQVEGPKANRADESQDEEACEEGEEGLKGQVGYPGAAP